MPIAGDGTEPGRPGLGLPAMRMPQMSQKSSLAESCPLGQIAIGASWIRRSPA